MNRLEFFLISMWLVFAAEIVLSNWWFAIYFRWGIPLFRRTFIYTEESSEELASEALSHEFWRGLMPSLEFRRFSSGEIGVQRVFFLLERVDDGYKLNPFRLFLFWFWVPLMHGMIRINHDRKTVRVTGYANWFTWFFAVTALTFMLQNEAVEPFLLALALLGLAYGLDVSLFRSVFSRVRSHYEGNLLRVPERSRGAEDAPTGVGARRGIDLPAREPGAEAFCPRCTAQYRSGVETCNDCGVDLVQFGSKEQIEGDSQWDR